MAYRKDECCLDSGAVVEVVVGPHDVKYFENPEGYTAFDGNEWRHYYSGVDLAGAIQSERGTAAGLFVIRGRVGRGSFQE
ncbi:MAG TPA: hypothetical protein VM163_13145 [bacterium]|nr:hypothetical protein [bacterium]